MLLYTQEKKASYMIQEGGAELPDCLNINNQKVPKKCQNHNFDCKGD